jgi:Flp pilus assembly protein TadG
MTILRTSRWKSEHGATQVEFALVTVLLVMVLLGVVEMGRMILAYNTVVDAARAGARYAMVHGYYRSGSGADGPSGPTCPCTQVNTVVQNYAAAGYLNTSSSSLTITVSYPDSNNLPGDRVSVSVQYAYSPILGYFGSILNKTLSSTSEGVITF